MGVRIHPAGLALLLAALAAAAPARALNKQGTRDEGVDGPGAGADGDPEFWALSGSLAAGGFLVNPTYAARPDNTGLAAGRMALHADLDLFWGVVTASYDLGGFTARGTPLQVSELDHILGLSLHLGPVELMAHYERDLPIDRGGFAPSALDAQVRLDVPRLAWGALAVSGYAGLGPMLAGDFPARPDNTGLAAARAIVHADIHPFLSWAFVRLELVGYTDRARPAALSELDTAATVGVAWRRIEVSLLAEVDRPVDRGGLSQRYLALLVGWCLGGAE